MIQNNVNQNLELIRSQLEQLNQEEEAAQNLIFEAVGKILFHLGERTQLLAFEKLGLENEKSALKHHIADMKLTHIAGWEAAFSHYKAQMVIVAKKIRAVLERFNWVKEHFIGISGQPFSDHLKILSGNNSAVEGYYKALGIIRVREEMETILADEGDESMWSEFLERAEIESVREKDLDYPLYPPFNPEVLVQENNQIALIPRGLENNPLVRTMTQGVVNKFRALEKEIVSLKEENRLFEVEKNQKCQAHLNHLKTHKLVHAAKFFEFLKRARFEYQSTERIINSTNIFKEGTDLRPRTPIPLTEERSQLIHEGYVQEGKRIQELISPLIFQLESIIFDYGKEIFGHEDKEVIEGRVKSIFETFCLIEQVKQEENP